jgi:hypothetical protein
MRLVRFFVVQPWGRDKARQSTIVYEAQTAHDAFAEIDRLADTMKKNGEAADAIELLVVDADRRLVNRHGTR